MTWTAGSHGEPWNQERADFAMAQWNDGLSASYVAKAMLRKFGIVLTRNAVIGKLFRMGATTRATTVHLTRHPTGRPRSAKTPKPSNSNGSHQLAARLTERQKATAAYKEAPIMFDATLAKPWLERAFGECAYPVSGNGADTFSCCAKTIPDLPYCPTHWKRTHSAPATDAQRKAAAHARAAKARAA